MSVGLCIKDLRVWVQVARKTLSDVYRQPKTLRASMKVLYLLKNDRPGHASG